jgi:hypothetical protein
MRINLLAIAGLCGVSVLLRESIPASSRRFSAKVVKFPLIAALELNQAANFVCRLHRHHSWCPEQSW